MSKGAEMFQILSYNISKWRRWYVFWLDLNSYMDFRNEKEKSPWLDKSVPEIASGLSVDAAVSANRRA